MQFCRTRPKKGYPQKSRLTPGGAWEKQNAGRRHPTSAPLQLFLATVDSKISHAEHKEKFSKVEQYSVSIAVTFNICQCPHQAPAVHLAGWGYLNPGVLCWSSPLRLAAILAKLPLLWYNKTNPLRETAFTLKIPDFSSNTIYNRDQESSIVTPSPPHPALMWLSRQKDTIEIEFTWDVLQLE